MPRIPFVDVNFVSSSIAERQEIKERLQNFLIKFREESSDEKCFGILFEDDLRMIERRTNAYYLALHRRSGLSHLDHNDRQALDSLRGGAILQPVETEHRADEIASALHAEMPWMGPATERVWHDLRNSVRRGDLAPRISPLLLVGPPGIGKSHWSRLLGDQLSVPTAVIEATSEPASFSVTGSQRGWSSSQPGKPIQGILASSIANPVLVVDEIEKVSGVNLVLSRFSSGLFRAMFAMKETRNGNEIHR